MEENSELEEGEAWFYKDDDDNNIDLDTSFSYIDEKIQNVLGHFQKDFGSEVSTQNLGTKLDAYGSFLPTYDHCPSIWLHPKAPQRSSCTPRASNNFHAEVTIQSTPQSLKVPFNAPLHIRLGAAPYNANGLINSRVASSDVSVKQDYGMPPVSAHSFSLRDGRSNKLGHLSDQRMLKIRLKVGADKIAQKKAAIYSGLGLHNSPSSSLGGSPGESGGNGMLHASQVIVDESPTYILQAMTSLPVPGAATISPLHESLLCLMKKKRLSNDIKYMPLLKGSQEHSASLIDESLSVLGNGKLSKEESELRGKSVRAEEFKLGNGIGSAMGKLENETPNGKHILPKNLKSMFMSNTVHDSGKSISWPLVASREPNEIILKDRSLCPELVEDSLESVSYQDNGEGGKRNPWNSSVEKVSDNREVTCTEDVVIDLKGSGSKINKTSAPSKACSDASICNETTMHCGKEKLLLGKKKSQGIESRKKAASVITKESLRVLSAASADSMITSYSKSRNKMQKLNSRKDILKVISNHIDSLDTKFDQTNTRMASERRSGDRPKGFPLNHSDIKLKAPSDKSKERLGKNKPMAGPSIKDAAFVVHVTENAVPSKDIPPALDNWVCCDNCQKWRLLPVGTKPEQLPEKWLCSMLNWLPGMNRCDISEDETTKALCQPSVSMGQINLQNHANGTASVVTSVQVEHVEQSHKSLDYGAVPSRGKKKCGLKEATKADDSRGLIEDPNAGKNYLLESVKRRSLNDMNHHPSEPSLMNKSSLLCLNSSCNFVAERHIKPKGKHMNGARDAKQVKVKNKRQADHHRYGSSKKTKTVDMDHADKHKNSDMDPWKVGLNLKSDSSTRVSGKNRQKSNGYVSEDVKCDAKESLLVSAMMVGDLALVSSDGVSSYMRMCDKKDISVKKRKLKECQENQNGHQSNIYAEGISGSGLKKEKKSRVSNNVARESSTNSANDKSNKKGKVSQIVVSGGKEYPVDGIEEITSIGMDQQPQLPRRKVASQQIFHGTDSLRKEFGSGQVSMPATSSSSKVSGSLKIRATFDDMKGSPVESVSSSPLRTLFSEKLISAGGNIPGKDDTVNGGLSTIGKLRCWEGEGDSEINQCAIARKEKVSGGSHTEPINFFPLDYRDGDANHRIDGKTKMSSGLFNGDADFMENCQSTDKNHRDNIFPQKPLKVSYLRSKENNRSSMSDFERENMNVSDLASYPENLSSKSARYESNIDPKPQTTLDKRKNNVRPTFPDKSISNSSKAEKDHVSRSDSVGQCSKDCRIENQLNTARQQNVIKDFEGENKLNKKEESGSGTTKLFSHSEGEGKQECLSHRMVPGSQQGGSLDVLPIKTPGNGVVPKALRQLGNAGTNNGAYQSLGHHVPHTREARDLNPSPVKTNSSSQTAANALKQAKDLRETADHLKSSGFLLESNQAYFQAAVEFLRGASLLETFSSGVGGKGEMTQLQAYGTAAKLCECCALEYERRLEMASAALAYKCMEVAYWRSVYCKNSFSNRARDELQANLQAILQGESPSSSASDVDNLNNQTIEDKSALSKGTIPQVDVNPVVVARNYSNFLRLLDFTQDVKFAVEASRKSQNALSSANVTLGEAQNREFINSVKRVVDFSFQDVEGLIRLVWLAWEAIGSSGFGVARD